MPSVLAQVQDVDLNVADGTRLKGTFFSAKERGPGVLLLHQCNRDRQSWLPLASALANHGINVLTMDYRGFGESGGRRFSELQPAEQQKMTTETWRDDIDAAYRFLVSQGSVDNARIGAGGASCGVNQSIYLAQRHPEVRALALLSGAADYQARTFLRRSANLALFLSAAGDDGPFVDMMEWIGHYSTNSATSTLLYDSGGHGVEMFAAHKELVPAIVDWFDSTLGQKPPQVGHKSTHASHDTGVEVWELLDQAGGAAKAAAIIEQKRKRTPGQEPFSEGIVNLIGYDWLQRGNPTEAIAVFKLNTMAFPESANAYDSLGDGYLANNELDLMEASARKALDLLEVDTKSSAQRKETIRRSAEQKLKPVNR